MEPELKNTIEELGKALKARNDADAEAKAEVKRIGEVSAETKSKLDKIQETLGQLDSIKTDLEKLQAINARPTVAGKSDDPHYAFNRKHMDAFKRHVRERSADSLANLQAVEREGIAAKAIVTTTPASGGYAVPEQISRQIHERLQNFSVMRQLATVITVGTPDYKELVDINGEEYGWVGETDARTETGTGELAEVQPTFGMIYAYPKASEESLDDIFFDVEAWMLRKTLKAFRKGEGVAFVSGDGTKKPTGFLHATKVAISDEDSPSRPFGQLQYIPTGAANGFQANLNDSPPGNPGDVLIDTVYALKAGYRANAGWLMNKNTLSRVRKFKDRDGAYLWQPSLVAGQPSLLAGYPVREDEEMPNVDAGAFPAAFGDFKEGYLICDRVGLRVTRDDVTTPGYVKFYVRKRVGGKLLNDEAIKLIKCATT